MTRITKVFASISLSLLILFATFFYVMGWETFYAYEIKKNNISDAVGISEEDLLPLYLVLTDYMVGKVDSIQIDTSVNGVDTPMYNQREIDHMVDVKFIISLLKRFIYALLVVLALSLFYLLRKKTDLKSIFIGQFYTTIAVFLGVIGMAMTDFNAYFIKFHQLFFTNDLWLLDPKTDRMIMLLPEVIFRDIVVVIVVGYALVSFFMATSGTLFLLRHKKICEV